MHWNWIARNITTVKLKLWSSTLLYHDVDRNIDFCILMSFLCIEIGPKIRATLSLTRRLHSFEKRHSVVYRASEMPSDVWLHVNEINIFDRYTKTHCERWSCILLSRGVLYMRIRALSRLLNMFPMLMVSLRSLSRITDVWQQRRHHMIDMTSLCWGQMNHSRGWMSLRVGFRSTLKPFYHRCLADVICGCEMSQFVSSFVRGRNRISTVCTISHACGYDETQQYRISIMSECKWTSLVTENRNRIGSVSLSGEWIVQKYVRVGMTNWMS